MMLTIEKISDKKAQDEVFKIRELVFVVEQGVNAAMEYDEFEPSSVHFLARINNKPVGTARWRFTEKGVKMERFAVLPEARSKGVGNALVTAVLEDINTNPEAAGKTKYLHSQVNAIRLYSKFGFKKIGEMFEECNIQHYRMQLV